MINDTSAFSAASYLAYKGAYPLLIEPTGRVTATDGYMFFTHEGCLSDWDTTLLLAPIKRPKILRSQRGVNLEFLTNGFGWSLTQSGTILNSFKVKERLQFPDYHVPELDATSPLKGDFVPLNARLVAPVLNILMSPNDKRAFGWYNVDELVLKWGHPNYDLYVRKLVSA